MSLGTFPFGQLVQEVVQTDRTQKHIFVLGVYASAVHARWISPQRKTLVNALAVASEPSIFWRGENAPDIIKNIEIPSALGSLEPAASQFNGPSGTALDERILRPLGLKRDDAWLCDLVPHSCGNPSQLAAIKRAYAAKARKHNLPKYSVPSIPKPLINTARREAILAELQESGASTLILLGDQPIRWFLARFDPQWKRLTEFVESGQGYGQMHRVLVAGRSLQVLPVAHPRQIAKLGQASPRWFHEHETWIGNNPSKVLD